MSDAPISESAVYRAIIQKIFFDHYVEGETEFLFTRDEIRSAATILQLEIPKNLGDVVYSFRFRQPLPESILDTQPGGREWLIEIIKRGLYAFRLVKASRILPRDDLVTIKIPDATPEIISEYALGDEQALLAKVRYNRLIDIFLGLTTYSLQSHLRTTLLSTSPMEIDELYVGLDRHGAHYVIPVQAKGGTDQVSVVQTRQDIQWCVERFPEIAIRSISAQFMANERIAMFLLTVEDDEVKVVEERHYQLVPRDQLDPNAIRTYRL